MRDLSKHRGYRAAPESGFTLPELMIVIVLMGILAAIAIPVWWGVIETRNVEAATNQVVSDMRLAHGKATNRLETWRVELYPDRGDEGDGEDYSLVRLDTVGNPIASSRISRTLPENALLNSPTLLPLGGTRAVQFTPDGSASAVGTLNLGAAATDDCPSGTPSTGPRIRITVDNSPKHCVTFNAATSKVEVD